MSYTVTLSPAVDKTIARLPNQVRGRLADRPVALAIDPRPPGSIKLTGSN